MKILCTGGVGFIASNVVIEAIKRGHKVVAFDNLSRNEVKNNLDYLEKTYKDKFKFVWGDVRKRDDFDKIGKVDALIHLAANPAVVTSIERPMWNYETNTTGTVNALEFAVKRGKIPVIFASTNKVYSDITNELPIEENEARYVWKPKFTWESGNGAFSVMKEGLLFENDRPIAINEKFPVDGFGKWGHSLYGTSKLAAELFCQEYHIQFGLPVVIFRMSCIFGLFQKGVCEQGWLSWFLRQLLFDDGRITIFGTGKQVRDVLDGRDTARAYLDALEGLSRADGEVFTLGGGTENSYSLLETIAVMENLTGRKAKLSFGKIRPSDQTIYISDISKAKKILNWKPKIKLEQALNDMIKEYEA